MDRAKRLVTLASILLVAAGVLSLVANLVFGGSVNLSWPLIFIVMGAIVLIQTESLAAKWDWAPLLYIPGCALVALGVVFLLNMITGDWNSWAYAWLLVVAGLGFGLMMTSRRRWRHELTVIGSSLCIAGIVFFVFFGAIAGGRFILVMAPILLVICGITLRWLRPETVLPVKILQKLERSSPDGNRPGAPGQGTLVEAISSRELEVLRLIDQGLTNAEIASRLSVAPSTVKTHINNIYGKLGVQSRVQALNRARELGLLNS